MLDELDELDDGANRSGFLIEREHVRDVTLVAFAGLKRPSRKFEFFKLLSRYENARCVFLADHEQAWYQLGVHGIGETADSVSAFLRDLLGADHSSAVFTGASAGGYAALLFGAQLGVAEVHAFAPQTFVSTRLRRFYRDRRWRTEIGAMNKQLGSRPAYLDIKQPLQRAQATPTALHVHVGTLRLDRAHARRISRIPGVELHRYSDIAQHGVARTLNQDGRLQTILDDAVTRRVPAREPRSTHHSVELPYRPKRRALLGL